MGRLFTICRVQVSSGLALATVCLLLSTGGPAFVATRRWALAIDFFNWPYTYSAVIIGISGVFLLRDNLRLSRQTPFVGSV